MFLQKLVVLLCAFPLIYGCSSKPWQKKTERTCQVQLQLTNVDVTVTPRLRIAGPTQIFTTPPAQWDSNLNKNAPTYDNPYLNYGVSCRSNVFADQKIQNGPVEGLSDQICTVTFQDEQQTRYDLLWHAADQSGQGTVTSKNASSEKITLTNLGREKDSTHECRVYEAPAKVLHFAEIPIAVKYLQIFRDGREPNNESEDGKRYETGCFASNFHHPSAGYTRHAGRDPGLFQETCSFSGDLALGTNSVAVTPFDGGIKAQVLNDQGKVMQELESKDCQ